MGILFFSKKLYGKMKSMESGRNFLAGYLDLEYNNRNMLDWPDLEKL